VQKKVEKIEYLKIRIKYNILSFLQEKEMQEESKKEKEKKKNKKKKTKTLGRAARTRAIT
jgi:hypothetical protein